ncbi:Beta-glucosidase [Acetobacteraceae bacterium EV16P]|uniref:Beta-glucosidase n=2 Tax=Sorlinia euscelidii TaxID=3081148 RepID=A0ABU7U588_9PROT
MIAVEAAHRGLNEVLGGGINLVRDPRGGRNFEYQGEDPILAGIVAASLISGAQDQHVLSTIKHYALNSIETARTKMNSVIDEQSMQESDLLAFKIAIEKSDPASVMCGYNRVNGLHDCQNPYLLENVLRQEWGYHGYVMSDWGAVYDGDAAWKAGLDQQSGLPADSKAWFGDYMKRKVIAGKIPVSVVDEKLRHILYPMFKYGLFEPRVRPTETAADIAEHTAITQKIEEAGAVLLKNDHEALPLKQNLRRVLVVGGHADKGVMTGGGSSAVAPRGGSPVRGDEPNDLQHFPRPIGYLSGAPLDALKAEMPRAQVTFLSGDDLNAVTEAAKNADRVIVFATKWSSEFFDNADLSMPQHEDAMITAAVKAGKPVIVVLQTGNPVLMPWADKVDAVLEAWFPGSGGGKAIARLLTGKANPSGRLTTTWPVSASQLPRPQVKGMGLEFTLSKKQNPADYETRLDLNIEGANVGYRWFSLKGEKPLYPFGYGLSYTSFTHTGLEVDPSDNGLVAHTKVTNTGKRAGADVVQIYVNLPDGSPERLAGFLRVQLSPGESKDVAIPLSSYALARFDVATKHWVRKAGAYHFRVATNSFDNAGPSLTSELAQQ